MSAGIDQTLGKSSMDTTTTTPTIRVEIYNQTYNIRSDGDTEYIIQLAEFVDSRMREISSGTLTVDSLKVAILAALHVADELHRLKHLHEQADAQLATRSAECAEMLECVPPTWRIDIECEEDLVEEIARHLGYDKIGSELPPSNQSGEHNPKDLKLRKLRRTLQALGFDEAINFSFIDVAHDNQFELIPEFNNHDPEHAFITLKNPIIENEVRMRPTLIPGLLNSLRHNLNHGVRSVRLFETGRIFAKSNSGKLPNEREALALVATGGVSEENRAQAPRETDFYDLKGALEAAVAAMNRGPLRFTKGQVKHLREGQSAKILSAAGTPIGSLGRLAESVSDAYKFRQPVYVAELDLTRLLTAKELPVQYEPLPRYPSVIRDLTILVNRQITLEELLRTIEEQQVDDCRGAQLVGTYEGANIPEDRRAVTLRIEYRSDERTLRDEEVEERQRGLIDSLLRQYSAQLH